MVGDRVGHALLLEAGAERRPAGLVASPAIISEKNTPIDSAVPEFWNVERIPDAAPRWRAGTLLMIEAEFGALNMPTPIPLSVISAANAQYGKSTGSSISPMKLAANTSMPAVAKPARAEPVGQIARDRTRDQERGGQREQVDPGPQRRLGVAVAVQRQPDALQPDDQHELQAAASDRRDQAGDVAGGERADAEQAELEHRIGDPRLDQDERGEQRDAADERPDHDRVRPAHGVAAVRLDRRS